ncbi:hypothetical protein [Vreelandella utahensis]|uniref:hypothetical protein n=1 Tax=Vreelandella halophila TaxID=86177 RepID=UPI000987CFB2|nr:hypothetical protein [Halomonas utahensis]
MTPVAWVVGLLENSPSSAPQILGGLQASADLSQGDASLETFLRVNQHSQDSVDPINYSENLANLNLLIGQINGDRTTPNAADDRYSDNVENFNTEPLNITLGNGFQIDSLAAPLTGSEALSKTLGANSVPVASGVSTPAISRYLVGVHGTPVIPQAKTAEESDVLKDRTLAAGEETVVNSASAQGAFGEMVAQTLDLIADPSEVSGGGDAGNANPALLQIATTS